MTQWLEDFAAQGIFTTDADLTIRSWNRWLEIHSELHATEIVGRNLFGVFPDLLSRGLDEHYRNALAGKAVVLSQQLNKYLLPMASSVPEAPLWTMQQKAQIAPLVQDGSIVGTITVIDDVTERVVRETELQRQIAALEVMREVLEESESRYRVLADNAIVGVELSQDGIIRYVNPAYAFMFGYAIEEVVGRHTPLGNVLPEERVRHAESVRRLATGEIATAREEVICVRKDGTPFHVEIFAASVIYKGRPAIMATLLDITERKRAEAALRESNRRLEETLVQLKTAQEQLIQQERLRAIGHMASGIAHNFNNALAPILGFADLLLNAPERLRDVEEVKHYIQMMHTAAQDAASIVTELRNFYRQSEDVDVMQPVDLNRVVEQAVFLTEPRWKDEMRAKGVHVTVQTELQVVPVIMGNESQLREVLTNLVFNAVDAMPNGGEIVVRTRVEEIGKLGDWEIEKPETVPISQFPNFLSRRFRGQRHRHWHDRRDPSTRAGAVFHHERRKRYRFGTGDRVRYGAATRRDN